MAYGPMSTPRRPAPRSIGTPMMPTSRTPLAAARMLACVIVVEASTSFTSQVACRDHLAQQGRRREARLLELVDRDGRCVAGQQRVGRADPVELGEGLALDVRVFRRRFDDQIARGEVVEAGRAAQTLQRFVALGSAKLAAVNRRPERPLDALTTLCQKLVVDLTNDRGVAGPGAHLGDARAHQPTADDADSSNVH